MRRYLMPGLFALVASTIYVQASTPAPPQAQQPFRKLEYSRIGPWEVAAIGNDEKVNHCALARGTASPDPKQGEPKFLLLVDKETMILRLRAAEYKFTEKKALAVTAITRGGRGEQAARRDRRARSRRYPLQRRAEGARRAARHEASRYPHRGCDRAALVRRARRSSAHVQAVPREYRLAGERLERCRVRADPQIR